MNTASNSDTPDADLTVAGVRLADIVSSPGPFASLFIGPGSGGRGRAQLAIDSIPIPASHAGRVLDAIDDEHGRSQVVVAGSSDVWRFLLDDPLAADLARFGDIPSLGPLIEAAQVTATHVVITVEDDVYGLTSFGTVSSIPLVPGGEPEPLTEPSILEALDHVVDAIKALQPRMVALMGETDDIAEAQDHLQRVFPFLRCNSYPTVDIDQDLLAVADEVVKDAASLAAERRTHELAHFRQARAAAQAQEGLAALGAIEAGSAQRLLVHDDIDATVDASGSRTTDRAIVAAVRMGVPITMIPNVPADRGPKDGLGVITIGHGSAVPAQMSEPEDSDHAHASV